MTARIGRVGYATLLALFFSWGLIAVLGRMTVPLFKEEFALGYRDAMLVQSAFFLTYLFLARASGAITARIGFAQGAATGLVLMSAGSLGIAMTTWAESFLAFLPSVFLLACGVTFLQVSANPLAATSGHLPSAAGNLTFAQSFNSFGTVVAPLIAAATFLSVPELGLKSLRELFVALAIVLLVLAAIAAKSLRDADETQDPGVAEPHRPMTAFDRRRLAAAVAAIFLYVGAEVSITTTLVNILESEHIIDATRARGASLASLFWLCMLLGRLAAVPLLVRFARERVLACAAVAAAGLCLVAVTVGGVAGGVAVIAIGLAAGLQFPTIFAIASADLAPPDRARAAGWLCTGIVGGGVVPLVYGAVADGFSIEAALVVPAACFIVIAGFALRFGRTDRVSRPSR